MELTLALFGSLYRLQESLAAHAQDSEAVRFECESLAAVTLAQAQRLEVWELDPNEGDADLTGSALRLTLTGSRGLAVTALWLSAIEKQKRNDFHEFETRVRMVTKLQPNFITPWIFQSRLVRSELASARTLPPRLHDTAVTGLVWPVRK